MKAKITNSSYWNVMPTWRFGALMVSVFFLFFNSISFAQGNGQYTLGWPDASSGAISSGESNKNGVTPFMASRRDSRNQYFYKASELTTKSVGKGRITQLAFYVTALPSGSNDKTMKNVRISIDSTAATVMPPTNTAPSSTVFQEITSLEILPSQVPGWITFDITKNGVYPDGFLWDPAGANPNIFVEICISGAKISYPTGTNGNFKVKTSNFPTGPGAPGPLYMNNGFYGINGNATPVGCDMAAGVSGTTPAGTSERIVRPDIQFTFRCEGLPSAGVTKIQGSTLSPAVDVDINYCIGPVSAANYNELVVLGSDSNYSQIKREWKSSIDGVTYVPIPLATDATYKALKEDHDVWYCRIDECKSDPGITITSTPILIGADVWNGTEWTFEGISGTSEPGINHSAVFTGNFNSATAGPSSTPANLEYCSVVVKSGKVTISPGNNLLVDKQVTVLGGKLVFENSASLNQISNSGSINHGDVTFKRTTQPVMWYDFTYWSSPVVKQDLPIAKQTLNHFSPNTRSDKYFSWDGSGQKWTEEVSATTTMEEGIGYIIRAPDSLKAFATTRLWTGKFLGVPNNGDVDVTTIKGSTLVEKWNLIGNPYPSALNAIQFFDDNSSVLYGTFYLWTHNSAPSSAIIIPGAIYNYNPEDYASFNKTGGIPDWQGKKADASGVNNSKPSGYIASGQSFMIRGTVDGTVTFRNSQRVQGDNSNFYKPIKNAKSSTNSAVKLANSKSRVWLEYVNEKGGFKQLLVGYLNGATADYDNGFDGDIMESSGVSFFSIIKDHQLGIQGKGLPFDDSDTIPLGFTATVEGNNTIALVNYDGLFDNQGVYVEDTYLNVIHNLKTSNYTFIATKGTFLDRFVLRYTENALNLTPIQNSGNNIVAFNKSGNLVVNAGNATIQSIKVYDLGGRLILQKNNCQSVNVVFEKLNWNEQLMLVKILTDDNVEVTRKVLF